MYLKIVRELPVAAKNAAEIPTETMIECRKYDMFLRGDDLLHFWVVYFDSKRATFEIPKEEGHELYVMNNNGKTLESFGWANS